MEKLSDHWAGLVSAAPRRLLALLLGLTVLLGLLTFPRLSFSNDRTRLLDPNSPVQAQFERLRGLLGGEQEVVVLIWGAAPEQLRLAADDLAQRFRARPQLERVLGSFELPFLKHQAIYYLTLDQLNDMRTHLNEQASDGPLLAQLEESLKAGGRFKYRSPFGPAPPQLESRFYLKMSPEVLGVLAQPRPATLPAAQLLAWLRQDLAATQARFPGLHMLLGGDFAAFTDDASAAVNTALRAAFISILLVHFFFLLSFGRRGPPRVALLTTVTAVLWAAGWAALKVGQLNLITINFAATLVGLGMDFNIHMLFRFEEQRRQRPLREALAATLVSTGRENLVGALATSAAFFSLTLTPFQGVAQLGWISGVGVLLCWVASVSVLPALLCVTPESSGPPASARFAFLEKLETELRARPKPVLGLAALFSLACLARAGNIGFDYNLLRMQPPSSVAITSDAAFHQLCGHCGLFLVSVAPDEKALRERVERLEKLSSVAKVESPAAWLPAHMEEKRPLVEDLLRQAQQRALPPPAHLRTSAELLKMRDTWKGRSPSLDAVLEKLGPGPIQDGMLAFEEALSGDIKVRLLWLKTQKPLPLPDWKDFPDQLMSRYRGPQGQWLIKIYPREDVWEAEPLRRFLAQVREVDGEVTGVPCLTLEYLENLRSSYQVAGRNALAAIALLLLLHFRHPGRALLALSPKLLGILWMLGIMGWTGLSFNPANATALPLTLGIGLVFGVHVLHHKIDDPAAPLFGGATGAAVIVSGISTILGYASLIFTPYRGIASLGFVMGVGVLANLITSLVVLSAWLDLLKGSKTNALESS